MLVMLKVINRHTAAIDDIAPKAEGVMADTAPVRAMVAAGMLEVIGEAPETGPLSGEPGAAVPASEVRRMSADFDRAYAARGEALDKMRTQLAQVQADRDDLAARLESAEKALSEAGQSALADKGEKAPKAKDKG